MPTNTPRSIAEALIAKWRAEALSARKRAAETMKRKVAEMEHGKDAAFRACADELQAELQALATANGAEGLPEAVLDAALLDMFPGDHSAYLRVNWRDTMRRVLTAAILATRPQAASDGEGARILGLLAKRANFADVSEGWVARTPLCEHRLDADQSRVWNAAIRAAAAMTTDAAKEEGK